MTRVSVFIDGFNLYHGLRDEHDRRYLWLDLPLVAERLLEPGQTLVGVQYFTAIVRSDGVSRHNQRVYLDALAARGGVAVTLGHYREKQMVCRGCGESWRAYEEKETDVSIAVALLAGAVRDEFDAAVLLSADGDLCPGVRALKELFPGKGVTAVFPPRRRSDDLGRVADASYTLDEAILRGSLLPEIVPGGDDDECRRPERWY